MANNQYGQTYSGNDDFRGWLAAGNYKLAPSSSWSPVGSGKDLLKYVGNDGKAGTSNAIVNMYAKDAYNQWKSGRTAEAAAKILSDQQNAAIDRQTAAIYAQIAAQPKLIYRDVNAAWQSAQNKAASSVNPVYQDNLTRKLKQIATARSQKTADINASKTAADVNLQQTQEDIATQRQRTGQDLTSALEQSRYQEGQWQRQEGREADINESQARIALGDQAQEGLGAQSLETQKIVRNEGSAAATKDFTDARASKELIASRTFQDLDTKNTRAVQLNTTTKKNLDRQLSDFIANQELEEQEFRASNEAARLAALYTATQNVYKTDTAKWLSSLAKSGARSQDIALTTQVYG